MEVFLSDGKLNISPAYLQPGFAFGGSCLPKDLSALVQQSKQLELKLLLLESLLPSNREHIHRALQQALQLPATQIGVFGLAFKENTDDLREKPAIPLIGGLLAKGRHVRVFDPHIQLDQIYGSNRKVVLEAIPHIEKFMHWNLDQILAWAECLVITHRPNPRNARTHCGVRHSCSGPDQKRPSARHVRLQLNTVTTESAARDRPPDPPSGRSE